jgi:hypothetical protein
MYTEELKYSSTNNSFDYKLTIFYSICNRSYVPLEAHAKALPIILIGLALNQYFNGGLATRTFEEACRHLRGFFEGPGYGGI